MARALCLSCLNLHCLDKPCFSSDCSCRSVLAVAVDVHDTYSTIAGGLPPWATQRPLCISPVATLAAGWATAAAAGLLLLQVSCSQGGSCLSVSPSKSGTTSSAQQAAVELPNQPPIVTLVPYPSNSSVVSIKRGSSYGPCASGVVPTAEAPCEPGATAVDPDGLPATQGVNGSTTLNLTAQVIPLLPTLLKHWHGILCVSRVCRRHKQGSW